MAVLGFLYFLWFNDEIPLLFCLFYLIGGPYRFYKIVYTHEIEWVRIHYADNFFQLTPELGIKAMNLWLLGTVILISSYALTIGRKKSKAIYELVNVSTFWKVKTRTIIITLIVFLVLLFGNFFTSVLGGVYSFFSGIVFGGFILVFFLLMVRLKKFSYRILSLVLLIVCYQLFHNRFGYLESTIRFISLGPLVVMGYFLVYKWSSVKKVFIYSIGGALLLFYFTFISLAKFNYSKNSEIVFKRIQKLEDLNMLDGFVMLLNVYPERLDYGYGIEHAELFIRWIPRRLWPNKPVGGYVNKLNLNDIYSTRGLMVGISPTLFGSFYGEGGIIGIILLSILYGWILAKIVNASYKTNPDLGAIIRGVLIASLVALIRGGDLAGIYVIIILCFFPVVYLLRGYKRYVKMKISRVMLARD